MSDLIATTHKKENTFISSNNDNFPVIDVQDFTQVMRLEGAITLDRKTYALQQAITDVNDELADNTNIDVWHYKEAVYCHAMADILQAYRSYDTTKSGAEKADNLEPNIDIYKQRHREAIRKLLQKTRITVELI